LCINYSLDILEFDYATIAEQNDKNETVGGSLPQLHRVNFPPTLPDVTLDAPDGVVVEDNTGTILAIHIPGVCAGLEVRSLILCKLKTNQFFRMK